MRKHALAVMIAALSTNALAAGHMLPELSSLNASTAGAGSAALAESALTSWTNPAGMSQLDEAQLTVNLAALGTSIEYSDDRANDINGFDKNIDAGSWAPIASMYFVTPINDKFHAGIALGSQGGSGVDYGDNFSGGVLLENVEFMTVQLMPSISYKVNEKLSLGAAINFEYLTASGELNPLNRVPGLTEADAADFTTGYTLSAFYKFNRKHRVGITYRSEIGHYGEGDVQQSNGANKHDVGLDFIMPAQVQVSGVHKINNSWDMLWSASWYDLSTWTDLTLDINNISATVVERNFDDVWNIALGTHYQFSRKLRLETGISYETSPQDNPENQYLDLPVDKTKRFGLGATYAIDKQWTLRGYYTYIDLGTPEVNHSTGLIKGSYNNSAHYVGIQANFSFL